MRFRCNSCGNPAWPKMLEFEGDAPGTCPRCGLTGQPYIAILCDVHFVVLDAKGPIRGNTGQNRHGGQRVACEPGRPYLALQGQFFSATGEVEQVTCPRCKGTQLYREAAARNEELARALAQAREAKLTVVDLGG